ncbi:MAG: sialidase family protein [Terriglobales bacterium]
MSSLAWAAPPRFSAQKRIGLTSGDQWEPAVAADAVGHIYVLYPQYGRVPDCKFCQVPTMLLLVSNDNGKTWQPPHIMFESGSGQFDAQLAIDPADHRTLFAAWLDNRKREVIVAKSLDLGASWILSVAVRGNVELDKPALAVRGQNVYVAFNHEEEVWVASSQNAAHSFTWTRVNAESRPGWSLLGSATVDPAGDVFLGWASYSKAGGARGSVELYVSKSADAGKTWTHKLLDVSAASPDCKDEDCGEGYLGAQIALTSDSDGTLYALWNAGQAPMAPQQIYFSSSTSSGENWLPRVTVSSAEPAAEHAFPAIAAGSNGDVRIAWMGSSLAPDSRDTRYWNTYYRSSSNGGATWTDELRVSGYVPGYRYIRNEGFRFPFGDYFGMAIDNHNDTHIVWGEGLNYQSPGSIWHATGR